MRLQVILAAIAVAIGVDLAVAALRGYRFRTNVLELAALDAVVVTAIVLFGILAGSVAARFFRAPAPVATLLRQGPIGRAPLIGAWLAAVALAAFGLRPVPTGMELLAPPRASAPTPATPDAPNLLVIVADTLRADHIGAYGYARPTTPALDAFAARATVFEQAISSSAFTLPAHATLFTGLFPASHGADVIADDAGLSLADLGRLGDHAATRPLAAAARTLAEIALDGGLETGAVCANTAYLFRYFGLDQGFETYVDPPGAVKSARPVGLSVADGAHAYARALRRALRPDEPAGVDAAPPASPSLRDVEAAPPAASSRGGLLRRLAWELRRVLDSNERYYLLASEVNEIALAWLEPRRDRRFLLFLNYMDPHEPYLPIGEFRDAFPAASAPQWIDRDAIRGRERGILPEEAAPLIDAYDAEIQYFDRHLGVLLAQLEAWGVLDETVVVIVGDHGESFGEHNELGHCNNVYQPEVRIPLIVREPGQKEGRRVSRFVHLVDVFPTLLDLARLSRPEGLQGASLFEESRPLPAVAFMGRYADLAHSLPRWYDREHHAVYRDPWKLVVHSDGGRELYDLRADPDELRDLAAERPALVRELEAELERFSAQALPRFEGDGAAPSGEALERLRRLGYAD